MSKEYIEREAAIAIADYAADEHPYDKDPEKPETFSEYNEGWNDACDYIREKLENATAADVAEVRHGHLVSTGMDEAYVEFGDCTICGGDNFIKAKFCNWCGAKMDGEEKSASDGGADKALRGDET